MQKERKRERPNTSKDFARCYFILSCVTLPNSLPGPFGKKIKNKFKKSCTVNEATKIIDLNNI